jgi:hypothetical protein
MPVSSTTPTDDYYDGGQTLCGTRGEYAVYTEVYSWDTSLRLVYPRLWNPL